MCKEMYMTLDGKTVHYGPFSTNTGPDDLIRRPGKTKQDHASGAWDNHVQNRNAKAQQNQEWAGTDRKGGRAAR